MKRNQLILSLMLMFVLMSLKAAHGAGTPPTVGGQLPDIKLAMPKNSDDKKYLGLFGFSSFRIPQIKAQLLIVQIFSMYCPYCQKDAPKVNELYVKIEQNPALKGKIKIIGIGVGNSLYEVEIFKTRYNVLFPLFADGDYSIHKQIGEVRTPYFIGININPDGSQQIFYSKLGSFESAEQFLEMLVKLSKLQ